MTGLDLVDGHEAFDLGWRWSYEALAYEIAVALFDRIARGIRLGRRQVMHLTGGWSSVADHTGVDEEVEKCADVFEGVAREH